ncbi:excisionase [Pectobacterium aroidearum]|uniref:excisionase n=1 Tax=Pectobacterium aroidearum TaxID=1201031 RepID=UPI001F0857B6|nr:excisionase [Pectobacterium brasiliense]
MGVIVNFSLDCIPISTYCREVGESIDTINKRIQRKVWVEGVHVLKVDGVKERWVDLAEVARWARKNKDQYHSQGG